MRVDDDPTTSGTLRPFGWAVEFDVDTDRTTYEVIAIVDGIENPDTVGAESRRVNGAAVARNGEIERHANRHRGGDH